MKYMANIWIYIFTSKIVLIVNQTALDVILHSGVLLNVIQHVFSVIASIYGHTMLL